MEGRLRRLEKQLGGEHEDYGPILIVEVRTWSLAHQDAFQVGTPEEREELIFAHTGRRPAAIGARAPIRTIIDMPPAPLDSGAAIAEAERILDRSERCARRQRTTWAPR